MNIDYGKLLKDSAQFTLKYKILWVFGFLIALFSNSNNSSNLNSYDLDNESLDRISISVSDFVDSPYFWLTVIVLIVLGLIMMVVSWYLSRVSKVALINAENYDETGQGEKISIAGLWKGTHKYLPTIFGFDVLWFFSGLFIALIIILPIVLLIVFMGSEVMPLLCCLIILTFLFLMIIGIPIICIGEIGIRSIVLEDKGVLDSIKRGWEILSKHIFKFVLAWIVLLLPSCLFSIVFFVILMITMLPLVFLVVSLVTNSDTLLIGIGMGVAGCCLSMIFLAIVRSPFIVFSQTYWTKFIKILLGRNLREGESEIKEAI